MTTMYTVELEDHIICDGSASATMVKTVSLPFVPVPSIGIGLEQYSDFNFDELVVDRVIWIAARGMFRVRLKRECRYRSDQKEMYRRSIRWLAARGWRCRLADEPCASADEAVEHKSASHLIRTAAGYLTADRDEIECLELEGTEFEVIRVLESP